MILVPWHSGVFAKTAVNAGNLRLDSALYVSSRSNGSTHRTTELEFIMKSLLLWIIGVPISVIILLNLFNVI